MADVVEHVSCAKCGRIFHVTDLNGDGHCPACAAAPKKAAAKRKEK